MIDVEKKIRNLLNSRKYKPMNASELAEQCNIEDSEYQHFCTQLQDLELKGVVVKVKNRQYANPKRVNLMVGKLECNRKGFGFVVPVQEGTSSDIYINEADMSNAMHGDVVVVRLPSPAKSGRKKRNRDSGKIVNILYRANETVVGTFKRGKHLSYVAPDNQSICRDVYVPHEDSKEIEHDDKVVVKINQWPNRHLNAEGSIIEVLGKSDDPAIDTHSIIHQFQIPFTFSKEVLAEIEFLPLLIEQDKDDNRLDLRSEFIITIDPDDAKDFDDAISLKRDNNENWLLGVHITDVSYYIQYNSALDREARKRGTSVYLPGTVIPMLPETLSNGICSLKEGEDRLTKSVLFTYSPNGLLLGFKIMHSIINVKKRLTYDNATKIILENNGGNPDQVESDSLAHTLSIMCMFAKVLYKKRLMNGALELNLPEISIKIGTSGTIDSIEKVTRDISHIIIEEFMIAANQIVAKFMHTKNLPSLYRIHPEPDEDRMDDFAEFIFLSMGKRINPYNNFELQTFLKEIENHPESYVINMMMLKSLQKAIYSAARAPHYALAVEDYTHFTSPIRRYPDLVVHRLLDLFLSGQLKSNKVKAQWREIISGWADHCSFTEKRAEDAEREIIKLKLLRYLEDQMDRVMQGVITGIQEYGLFVQLDEFLLDGLIHIRTLTDDFYQLDKKRVSLIGTRSGRTFRFGDTVTVKITKIDLLKREVDFVLV
ncbi:MAG: ribonuclease R [Candidatus Scalindua sp.]|nr:ribonuclease R [Planctomycetota bacterium]GJQ60468.1 MAG: ribonuclease R [Candidatus Scalindua sp.]